ncbi:MAG TPA: amylo-alpha-1,6-glucosidase [Xanthobacteraceae bacterium]|nr:amylo-alpha-1,6-glucosidase [Xanthobacteraceae bacterium]
MQTEVTEDTETLIELVPEVPFYIPATGPATRPRRTLKHDDTFAVVDSHGDIGAAKGGPDGVFHRDTRFLSRLELLLSGRQPLLLGSNLRDDNAVLTVALTNPDIYFDNRLVLAKDTLHLDRTIFLWNATLYQRIAVTNHGDRALEMQLAFTFGSDFSDLFEVRGARRPRRGTSKVSVADPQSVVLRYDGLDGKRRETRIIFDPKPAELSEGAARFRVKLAPGDVIPIFIAVQCDYREKEPVRRFFPALLSAHHEVKAAARGVATVETSNAVFNELLCRSLADLYMLTTRTPDGPYPYGGIPWYSTTFGRDGLITALQALWFDPRIARGVLNRLAAYQAKEYDAFSDAERGKILHEMRCGEMAALREIPFGLYYGSVDSTPLFVLLAGLYFARTADGQTLRALWPAIEAALEWIDGAADPDQDGFVEYFRQNEDGLVNQGWKDSHDAIFHADGKLAVGPIAVAEVQGYVYAAKRTLARCADHLGKHEHAIALDDQASKLADQFERAFWCENLGTYALALDGHKRPCKVRASNAGQLLLSGMIDAGRARKVADNLLHPRFFSGWGIRTVAEEEARYNPMSYHNGSVWPHDNALIALGLSRYGMKPAVERIFTALFEAASYMDLRRLPELFCGFRRGRGRGPTLYPVACSPQAWASTTPFSLLQSSLGLELDPFADEIRLRGPTLPAFIDRVLIRNLRVGSATADITVQKERDRPVSVQVLRHDAPVRVIVTSD